VVNDGTVARYMNSCTHSETHVCIPVSTSVSAYPRLTNAMLSTKYFDDESELAHYGYRYYSPELGRSISRDPLVEIGGYNVYGFVDNAPAYRIDPLGLTPWDWNPIIGTWLAWRDKPKGSLATDYPYTLPTPCDDIDEALCVRAIDAQAISYIASANAPAAVGVALDAVAAFIAAGKGIPLTIVSAVLAVDGVVKAGIIIHNTNGIRAGAEAAKKEKCHCCPPLGSSSGP